MNININKLAGDRDLSLGNIRTRDSHLQSRVDCLSKSDLIYLTTILRRQYYVLRDLYTLHDDYPELIDGDLVGGLDGIFRALHDMSESLTLTRPELAR